MKGIPIFTFVLIIVVSGPLHARIDNYDAKGLKVYTKYCKSCHGHPYKGAAMKRSLQWRKLFRNDAKKFRRLHNGTPAEEEIAALLTRKSKTKHLRRFLIQSASDSGVVTSCDGNFCGR